jgi:hypothetical protein
MSAVDVGDVWPDLSITWAADPDLLVLTLTLPDGSTLVGSYPADVGDDLTITRSAAGSFACTHVLTLPGRHTARWVGTGTVDRAHTDALNVSASTNIPLISLADIRAQTRANATTADEELRWYGLVASRMAEDHTQLWRRQTLVERFNGGTEYLILQRPLVSVTSVVVDGTALSGGEGVAWTTDLTRGRLYRGGPLAPLPWPCSVQGTVVTYVGGPADGVVPENVLQGVRLQVQHLWDSQRGGSGIPRQSGADFTTDGRTGYSIPNRVLELWRASIPMGGYYVA